MTMLPVTRVWFGSNTQRVGKRSACAAAADLALVGKSSPVPSPYAVMRAEALKTSTRLAASAMLASRKTLENSTKARWQPFV